VIRRIGRALLLLAVLVAVVLAVAFPTDEVARWVVARATPQGGASLTFRSARLRPTGIHLEGAALRRSDGSALLEAPWVRLRPSWLALLGERRGRPWSLGAGLCTGTVDLELDADGADQQLEVTWDRLDLGTCLPELVPQLELSGFGTGEASLRIPSSDPLTGSGVFDLSKAVWEVDAPSIGPVTVRADDATLRWGLDPKQLTVERFSLVGPDVEIEMDGNVRLNRTNLGDGRLDLNADVVLVPGGDPVFQRLLSAFPPDDDGTRRLRITGSLDAPQVQPQ